MKAVKYAHECITRVVVPANSSCKAAGLSGTPAGGHLYFDISRLGSETIPSAGRRDFATHPNPVGIPCGLPNPEWLCHTSVVGIVLYQLMASASGKSYAAGQPYGQPFAYTVKHPPPHRRISLNWHESSLTVCTKGH